MCLMKLLFVIGRICMEQNRQIYGDDLPVGHCRNRGSSGCSRHCLPCEAIGRICMEQNRQIYGDDLPVGH